MNNWLYPLSRTSGFVFLDASDNELPDTCYGCFLHMHHQKVTDDHWFLRTNFRNVEPGDAIWPYYGQADGDRGIVALAHAVRVHDDPGEPTVDLRWDRAITSRLLLAPFPAPDVRHYIQYPRTAVQGMDRHPHLVGALHHHIARIGK